MKNHRLCRWVTFLLCILRRCLQRPFLKAGAGRAVGAGRLGHAFHAGKGIMHVRRGKFAFAHAGDGATVTHGELAGQAVALVHRGHSGLQGLALTQRRMFAGAGPGTQGAKGRRSGHARHGSAPQGRLPEVRQPIPGRRDRPGRSGAACSCGTWRRSHRCTGGSGPPAGRGRCRPASGRLRG